MRYAIISDLHANFDALDRVVKDALDNGVDRFICLGDIVGYGPCPRETVRRVRELAAVTLLGNHDAAVVGTLSTEYFNELADAGVSRHRSVLDSADLAWLKTLPLQATVDGATFVHSSPIDPEHFSYIDDVESARQVFAQTSAQLTFVGHTHIAKVHLIGTSGTVYELTPLCFEIEAGKRYIVNVGSVGYPREVGGRCYSSYVIYDTEMNSVYFRSLPFVIASVLSRDRAVSKRGYKVSAAVAGLSLLLAIGALMLRSPSADKLAEADVVLFPTNRAVYANLKLTKNSAPAKLTITFADDSGTVLTVVEETVRRSSAKAFRAPAGATRAHFDLSSALDSTPAEVECFRPR